MKLILIYKVKWSNFQQGQIQAQGSPKDLAKSGIDIVKLVGVDEKRSSFTNLERQISALSTSSVASVHSYVNSEFEDEDEIDETSAKVVEMEASSKGKIKESILASYCAAGAGCSIWLLLGILIVIVNLLASAVDYWVSIWSELQMEAAINFKV